MTEFRPTRFEILPQVIKNLIIINVLFYLAKVTIGDSGYFNISDNLALHDVRSTFFKPWQIVTHLFLHGSLWHLVGNMVGLWMFGSILENLWGPKRFLTFYFLCGIGAALLHLTFLWYDYHQLVSDFELLKYHPSYETLSDFSLKYLGDANVPTTPGEIRQSIAEISQLVNDKISTPTVGASGAVFGILAAFVYLFPNTYLYLYLLVPIKAKWAGLFYFGYEVVMALQNSAGDNVARWAHIGGGIVGFLLVITWNKNRKRFY